MSDLELLEFASSLSLASAFELIEKEKALTVYVFEYNPCIHESGWITMSAHFSKINAYKAMRQHKIESFNEWRSRSRYFRKTIKFGIHENWTIGVLQILP